VAGEWVMEYYGFRTNGKGDLISNTCMKIIQGEKSDVGLIRLEACKRLLLKERRWPVRMDDPADSRNRLDCWKEKFMYKIGKREYRPYRWPNGMTRDPYIYFYAACVMFGKYDWIEEVKMPFYIWRPGIWAWRKTLYRRNWWNNFWYRKKGSHKHFYVTRLREFRAYAYDNA
jgi:hypothetical protein